MQHVWKVLNKPNTNTISKTKTTKYNITIKYNQKTYHESIFYLLI